MHFHQRFTMVLAIATLPTFSQQATSPNSEADSPIGQPAATADPDVVMHVGGDVKKPEVIHSVEAQFTDEARQAKFSGNVTIHLIVEKDGTPSHIKVVRGTGYGLSEKAVEAVSQYRFKPGTLLGEPVRVGLYVNVNFRILN
jgi:TonB family protein